MYNSEHEIKKALTRLEKFQDELQALYDTLNNAVTNGEHSVNVDNLQEVKVELKKLPSKFRDCALFIDNSVSDVLDAERQFLADADFESFLCGCNCAH